jgi:hypothetical protein
MRFAVLTMVLIAVVGRPGAAFAVANPELARQLAKEREKLQDEKDPVDRAKINIKISEILLASVSESIQTENFVRMDEELNEYAMTIEDAHSTLMNSGRDASKKAGGFKELEIALRKHVLRFDDLGRALSLDRRPPLDKVKKLASGIRDGLLKALFR